MKYTPVIPIGRNILKVPFSTIDTDSDETKLYIQKQEYQESDLKFTNLIKIFSKEQNGFKNLEDMLAKTSKIHKQLNSILNLIDNEKEMIEMELDELKKELSDMIQTIDIVESSVEINKNVTGDFEQLSKQTDEPSKNEASVG